MTGQTVDEKNNREAEAGDFQHHKAVTKEQKARDTVQKSSYKNATGSMTEYTQSPGKL